MFLCTSGQVYESTYVNLSLGYQPTHLGEPESFEGSNVAPKVIHSKYYKHLKKDAQHSHLGR